MCSADGGIKGTTQKFNFFTELMGDTLINPYCIIWTRKESHEEVKGIV